MQKTTVGKQRCITVVNEIVVGTKNPEDDHHTDCLPVSAAVATAQLQSIVTCVLR